MSLISMVNSANLKALLHAQPRRKAFNYALNSFERRRKRETLVSLPVYATMNVTNLCNLRCKFCEIHYFYKKARYEAGKVFPNNLTAALLRDHDRWLRYAIAIELSGATGEPFANPHVMEVIHHLKSLGIRLSATTNALLIDETAARQLIDSRFDSLLVSVHAGDSQTYRDLQGGDFDQLFARLEAIIGLRNRLNSRNPHIGINFALNRLNAHTIIPLMGRLKHIGVDSFIMNHYYASRNALEEDISFYSDTASCNAILKDAYSHAARIGLRMEPREPALLAPAKPPGREVTHRCEAPWTTIKFKGCVERQDSEYIGVCNRILLFRIDNKKFYENGGSFARDIWNSGIIRYLRKTANSEPSNPICRFCKNPLTPVVRSLDMVEYSRQRDDAIEEFFREFNRSGLETGDVQGLTLLGENPYKYDEKDGF